MVTGLSRNSTPGAKSTASTCRRDRSIGPRTETAPDHQPRPLVSVRWTKRPAEMPPATTTTVATAAIMFQLENVVSVTGRVPPSCSAMKESGVAAVSGPDPE